MSRPGHLDPALLLDAARRRWLLLVVPALLAPILAVASVKLVGPQRKASALILVRQSVKAAMLQDVTVGVALNSRLPEVRSLVRSPATVERVLRALGVIDESMSEMAIEFEVAGLANRIEVYGEGGGLVRIALSGRNAAHVSRALTMLTEAVIEELLGPRRRALESTATFLEEQLGRVKGELDQVEAELALARRANANSLPEVRRIKVEAYQKLVEALREAEGELATAGGGRTSAHEGQARLLNAARGRYARLKRSYTDAHPSVQGAVAEVRRLEAQLGLAPGQPVKVSRARNFDAAAAQRKVDFLRLRTDEAFTELRSFAGQEQRQARLERRREVKAASWSNLLKQFDEAIIARSLIERQQVNDVRIVEPPGRPMVTRTSTTSFVAAGGLAGGLLLGLVLLLLLELLDPTVRRPEEAEHATGVPVLGRLVR